MTETETACPDCGAMVPNLAAYRDDPDMTPTAHYDYVRLHRPPGCAYYQRHERERIAEFLTIIEVSGAREREAFERLARDPQTPAADLLLGIADIGKSAFFSAIAKADHWGCTEFFQEAFPEFGYPIVATALEEMDLPRRDDETGEVIREETA